MPQQHTPGDQVKFLSQWFLSWSEMQREDFLPVLLQAYQPRDHLNGLVGSYEALGTRGRRPSLFDCQMKLFHDWFAAWTEADRQTLLEDLRELDPEFMRQYEKRMADPEATTTQDDPSIGGTPLTSTADESQDSSQNPSSSISSPPSTLPRSHSPHDSGLEDSTLESELVDADKKNEAPGDDSNTTTITINTDSNTTTINTASPPPPPAKPANNVTVVEVGGESTSGGEGVFSMQDLANGLSADQSKVGADAEAGQMSPPAAASPTQQSQESEAVSAEH